MVPSSSALHKASSSAWTLKASLCTAVTNSPDAWLRCFRMTWVNTVPWSKNLRFCREESLHWLKNNTPVWISWIHCMFSFILHCNHNETYPGMLYQSIPINVATMSQPKTSKNSAERRKSAAATKVCSLFRRRCSVSWPVRSSEPKIIFADSLESTALLTRSDCMLDLHMSSPQASKIGQRNLTLRNPQLRPFFVARIGLFAKQGNSRTASVSRVLSAQPEIHLSFNHRWQKYLEGRALQSPNTKHNMLVCSQLLFKLLVLLSLFLDNSWYDPHGPSSFPSNIFKMQILDNIGAPSACMPVASAMGHSGQLLRNSRVSANHRSSSAISWQKLSVNHSWTDRINPAPSVTIHLVSPEWRPCDLGSSAALSKQKSSTIHLWGHQLYRSHTLFESKNCVLASGLEEKLVFWAKVWIFTNSKAHLYPSSIHPSTSTPQVALARLVGSCAWLPDPCCFGVAKTNMGYRQVHSVYYIYMLQLWHVCQIACNASTIASGWTQT